MINTINDVNKKNVIWGVGHSNVSFHRFLDLLTQAEIETVIDCRSKPRSRWPQYNQLQLEQRLVDNGIRYEYRGHNLGGLGVNEGQSETILELVARVSNSERIALMCSEGKPKDCHRSSLLAPLLESEGVRMNQLIYSEETA